MKRTITLTVWMSVLLLGMSLNIMAETTLQVLDFEAAGGYSTSVPEYITSTNAYYTRLDYATNSSSISIPAPYTNYQGSWIFTMEDTGGSTETQTMTCSSVDIAGYSALHVKVLVAGQNNTAGTLEVNKHMSFYANVDGVGEVLIGSFRGDGASSYLYKDDNLNGIIEAGETTVLTASFTEYDFAISGTGSSLVITVKCLLSTANEEGAFDNIRVLGTVTQPAPTATTDAANSLTSSGATMNGTVNANSAPTSVTFEYGLTTAYGSTVTALESPVTGTSALAVSYALTGLAANTTYHYRVVATNAGGTTYGDDVTFATSEVTGMDYATNEPLVLYPNPTHDGFYVNSGEAASELTVCTLSGQVVYRQSVRKGSYVSMASFTSGVYLVKVKDKIEKVVKH